MQSFVHLPLQDPPSKTSNYHFMVVEEVDHNSKVDDKTVATVVSKNKKKQKFDADRLPFCEFVTLVHLADDGKHQIVHYEHLDKVCTLPPIDSGLYFSIGTAIPGGLWSRCSFTLFQTSPWKANRSRSSLPNAFVCVGLGDNLVPTQPMCCGRGRRLVLVVGWPLPLPRPGLSFSNCAYNQTKRRSAHTTLWRSVFVERKALSCGWMRNGLWERTGFVTCSSQHGTNAVAAAKLTNGPKRGGLPN